MPSPNSPALLQHGSGDVGMDPVICSSKHVGSGEGRSQEETAAAAASVSLELVTAEGARPLFLCRLVLGAAQYQSACL